MEKSDSKIKLITAVVLLLTALLGAGWFVHVKTGPSLTLSPDVVCAGGAVGVSGEEWNHDRQVEFYMGSNGWPVGNAQVRDGGFSTTLTLGNSLPSNYGIAAVGQQTGTRVSVNLVVRALVAGGGC